MQSARVAPNGQSRALRNWSRIRLPTIIVLPPPSSSGTTKLPEARHEHEDAAGDDAGQRQRQRHLAERREAAGAEVGRRLAQLGSSRATDA